MSLRRLSAALLLGAALVVAPAVPAGACACGGLAPTPGSDVEVGEERAIVSWQDGVEQLDVLLGVLSSDTETGLVFPTPSPATVSLGDRADFDAIGRVIQPTRVEEYDWWAVPNEGSAGSAPPEVLDRVQLGPIEAVTLAASDSAGLAAWLDENGYGLSAEVEELLQGYVERGWYFVALRITGDEPLDGGLDPIRFRFESEQLVYPLELSRAATNPQTVRLYVAADHRQRVEFTSGGIPAGAFVSWAAPITGTEIAGLGDYLTVFEMYFFEPSTGILGDLVFSDALSDDTTGTEHRVTIPLAFGGIPLGWVAVGVGVFLVILVLAYVGSARGPRRPARTPSSAAVR